LVEKLYELKEKIDQGKPRERVLAATGRKQGDQLDTLAERNGAVEKTIRNWLDRFDEDCAGLVFERAVAILTRVPLILSIAAVFDY
jgi:lambda repressor-like predicted transcriptional regulator